MQIIPIRLTLVSGVSFWVKSMNVVYNVYAASEEMWISMAAPANPNGRKESPVLLTPVDALPIHPCVHVVSFVGLFMSRLLSLSRPYDTITTF